MAKLEKVAFSVFVGVPALVAIVGCWLTWLGAGRVTVAFETNNWSTTSGRIVKSEVRRWTEGGQRMFSDEIVHHAADLEYEYTVSGSAFTGTRVAIGDTSPRSAAEAGARLEPYPVGSSVTVFFDSEDPSRACLTPGATGSAWLLLIVGLILLIGGVRFVLIWVRELRVFSEFEPAVIDRNTDAICLSDH